MNESKSRNPTKTRAWLEANRARYPLMEKVCSKCKKLKAQSEYWKCSSAFTGLTSACKSCSITPKYRREQRDHALKRRYGISIEKYEELVEARGGKCEICQEQPAIKPLFVDHDHETGNIRGLLCDTCNRVLGIFKDSKRRFMAAHLYLIRTNKIWAQDITK